MIKHYWKSLLIVFVISFAFGTFFVHAKVEIKGYENFKIKTITGNSGELDIIEVSARYEHDGKPQELVIAEEGSILTSDSSYIDMIKEKFMNPFIQDIEKRNRQFMRGKVINHTNFFENDDWIAYVDIPWDFSNSRSVMGRTINIDVINKKTENRSKFSYELSTHHGNSYIDLIDILVMNDQVFIATEHFYNDESNIIVYEFDMHNEKLNEFYDFHMMSKGLYESNVVNVELLYIFPRESKEQDQIYFSDKLAEEENINSFNLLTKEMENIKFSTSVNTDYWSVAGNNKIYLVEQNGRKIDVVIYDYVKDQRNTHTFSFDKLADSDFYTRIYEDKLYMYNYKLGQGNKAYLSIGNLSTGEVVYMGEIIDDGVKKSDYQLWLSVDRDVTKDLLDSSIR